MCQYLAPLEKQFFLNSDKIAKILILIPSFSIKNSGGEVWQTF